MPTIRRPSTARQTVSLEKGTSAPAAGPYALGETTYPPIGPTPPSPGTLPFGAAFSLAGGVDGEDGQSIPGPPGAVGPVGPTGPPGTGGAGTLGPPGNDGVDGEAGVSIPGPVGPQGPMGVVGPQGPIGFGMDGDEGPEGFTIPGAPGPTGPPGALGPQGSIGIPGDAGEEGPEGMPIPGPVGPTGATGATGSAGGALNLITETITAASQTSVIFSSIATTGRDLVVVVRGRGDTSAALARILLQFNSDTGSNYSWSFLQNTGTGSTGSEYHPSTTSIEAGYITAAASPSNVPGAMEFTIFDFKGTTFSKCGQSQTNLMTANSSPNMFNPNFSGWWFNTSAVNAVKVFLDAGGFADNSVVSLYYRS